jgi:hypothetical protein
MNVTEQVNDEFWWEVAEACSYATFFHSPLWHRLACNANSNLKHRSIGVVTDEGTKAVLPLIETGQIAGGMLKKVASTYAGCYGGIIATGTVPDNQARKIYQKGAAIGNGVFGVNENPFQADHVDFWDEDEGEKSRDFTQVVNLKGSFDDLVRDFSKGHRSSLNKGRREGVIVRQADSLDDYRRYFGAYEASLKRWGEDATGKYPWELFERGFSLSKEYPNHIKLWLAEVEGEVASGAWCFYWNDHVVYWHGASYKRFFDYRPNNVLHAEIMKDALRDDYKFYDLNPSGGHSGVVQFKKRFGAEKRHFRRITLRSRKFRAISKVKEAFSNE